MEDRGGLHLDLKQPLFSTTLPSTNVKETFNPSNPLMITALTLPLLISCVVVLQTLTDEFLHRPGTLELGEFGELSLHLESILHQPIEMSSGSLNLIDNKCHLICILVSHGPEKSFFWLVASMHSTMNRHLQS